MVSFALVTPFTFHVANCPLGSVAPIEPATTACNVPESGLRVIISEKLSVFEVVVPALLFLQEEVPVTISTAIKMKRKRMVLSFFFITNKLIYGILSAR